MSIVWIKEVIIEEIFTQGNNFLPKETGGILMGYYQNNEYIVTNLIGPGENAIHEVASFQPDYDFHVQEVARIYEQSKYTVTYLGDWHTHPNSYPYLSSDDKRTLETIANYKKARLSNPLMLIAAPPKNDFKIWAYNRFENSQKKEYIEADMRTYK